MSGPTRGMVAGQAIQTQAVSKEYEEGFDRTFGARKRVRGKFVYDPERKEMVEVGADWSDTERRAPVVTEGIVYGNAVATDGTDLSSRTKYRDYLKANNLTPTSDFKDHWKKMAKEREAILSGEKDTKERKEIIGRALYERRKQR